MQIVTANDGHIFRDSESRLQDCFHGANRHRIVKTENAIRTRIKAEQLHGRSVTRVVGRFVGFIRAHNVFRTDRDAVLPAPICSIPSRWRYFPESLWSAARG